MIRFLQKRLLHFATLRRRHMPFLCRFLNRGSMKLRHGKSSSLPTFKELESFFYTHQMSGDTVKHVGKFCTTCQRSNTATELRHLIM